MSNPIELQFGMNIGVVFAFAFEVAVPCHALPCLHCLCVAVGGGAKLISCLKLNFSVGCRGCGDVKSNFGFICGLDGV